MNLAILVNVFSDFCVSITNHQTHCLTCYLWIAIELKFAQLHTFLNRNCKDGIITTSILKGWEEFGLWLNKAHQGQEFGLWQWITDNTTFKYLNSHLLLSLCFLVHKVETALRKRPKISTKNTTLWFISSLANKRSNFINLIIWTGMFFNNALACKHAPEWGKANLLSFPVCALLPSHANFSLHFSHQGAWNPHALNIYYLKILNSINFFNYLTAKSNMNFDYRVNSWQ